MKVLVAYMSKTGNTKKVAEAIFDEITTEKEIKTINDVDSIEGYDFAFLGFPTHGHGPDKKAVQFLQKHCVKGKKVALFITHGASEDEVNLQSYLDRFKEAARGASIVDMFHCQGERSKSLLFFMSVNPNARYRDTAKHDNSKGQPDKTRIDKARVFSRNVVKKLTDGS